MDIASRIWDHMESLSETIGPRPVGSPNHRAAAAYIEEQMREPASRYAGTSGIGPTGAARKSAWSRAV